MKTFDLMSTSIVSLLAHRTKRHDSSRVRARPRTPASLELVLSLLVLWLWLGTYSSRKEPWTIFGHAVTRSEVASFFEPALPVPMEHSPRGALAAQFERTESPAMLAASTTPGNLSTRAIDLAPQRILIFGDSMIDGLLPRLGDYAVENHHSVNAVIWYGSRTIDWARTTRLAEAISLYRPTFVIVVVGSSELHVQNAQKRAEAVERILQTIGSRQLVWIGPPNWTKDTGINDVIERTVGKTRFFPSYRLTFERKRDKIHPTLASSEKWLDEVARYITSESTSAIKLDVPRKTGTPRPNVRVYAPPTS